MNGSKKIVAFLGSVTLSLLLLTFADGGAGRELRPYEMSAIRAGDFVKGTCDHTTPPNNCCCWNAGEGIYDTCEKAGAKRGHCYTYPQTKCCNPFTESCGEKFENIDHYPGGCQCYDGCVCAGTGGCCSNLKPKNVACGKTYDECNQVEMWYCGG